MCRCIEGSEIKFQAVSNNWLNEEGKVVHPDAPLGGGGAGNFRAIGAISAADDILPDTASRAAVTLDPLRQQNAQDIQLQAAPPRNPPPRVTQASTQTIRGMTVTIQADATGVAGVRGAKTVLTPTSTGNIDAVTSDKGIVESFTNTIAYSVSIQTSYGNDPASLSAYGRGTTTTDKTAGNVTLGFHESCHRADFINYLTNTAVPTFGGKKGMKSDDFQTKMNEYDTAWETYFAAADTQSNTNTDETGDPTRSTYCAANPGSC